MTKFSEIWVNGTQNADDKAIPWTASASERSKSKPNFPIKLPAIVGCKQLLNCLFLLKNSHCNVPRCLVVGILATLC
jgi:hypothetical protein